MEKLHGQLLSGGWPFLFANKTGEKLMNIVSLQEYWKTPPNCKLFKSNNMVRDGIQTNVSQECRFCKETIEVGDRIELINLLNQKSKVEVDRVHAECQIRRVAGSVGHQAHKCFCFGGTKEDPPGLTERQAAIASVLLFFGEDKFKRLFPKHADMEFSKYYKAIVDVTTEPLIPKANEPNV